MFGSRGEARQVQTLTTPLITGHCPLTHCPLPTALLQSFLVSISFQIDATQNAARLGRLATPHGVVETPVFMPVGTVASVKGVSQDILEELGAEILLGNTYHLYLRPGVEQVRHLGGLHRFMSWPRHPH